jgi:hypothetical protein
MKLQFHQEALREYIKAMLWYAKRSFDAPFNFEAEVDSMVERIFANPLAFATVYKNKRKAVLKKFPFYLLIFESRADAIIVFAIAHSKRKASYWRRRRTYP